MWSVFFNLDCTSVDPLSYTPFTPANVHVVSDPDGSIGYEQSVDEVRYIAHTYFTLEYKTSSCDFSEGSGV